MSPDLKTRAHADAASIGGQDAARLLAALRPHLPSFGVTRVGDLTGLDVIGIPVAFAARPNARSLSVTQGKSLDPGEAALGAVMEALEQAFAERTEDLIEITGTSAALKAAGKTVANLRRIARALRIPAADEPVSWTRAHSLITGDEVYLPVDLVGLDLRANAASSPVATQVSSLGLGAHATWVRAATHALMEVLEHNATAALDIFGLMPGLARPLSYRRGTDPALDAITAKIEVADLDYQLYDLSPPQGLPVIAAAIGAPRAVSFAGYACRFAPEHAAEAALLEAVQSRLTMIAGARDDLKPADYADFASCSNQGNATRALDDLPRGHAHLRDAPPAEQLRAAVIAARRIGAEDVYVAHVGGIPGLMAVVRVITTGLEASGFNGTALLGRRTLDALLGQAER